MLFMDYMIFIITIACVSFLPGLCMNLALSLGLSVGFKNTLYMMFGELLSLLLVILLCAYSLSFIAQYELFFKIFKILSSIFLLYIAYTLLKAKFAEAECVISNKAKFVLFVQGFMATISNPKAWIFMLSILPKFISLSNIYILSAIILLIEFSALCTYALGGYAFRFFLKDYAHILAKISALCVALMSFYILYDL